MDLLALLSVSSNGSLGLKRYEDLADELEKIPFSILERIVGVETAGYYYPPPVPHHAFSILERIVGVETEMQAQPFVFKLRLSVSSNGSLGLKPDVVSVITLHDSLFQYPRTDRWG